MGDLVSRQVTDAEALEDGLKAVVTEAGVHLVLVLGILGLLFALNAKLTLVVLPFMFILAVSMHFFRSAVKSSSFRVRDRLGRLSSMVTETLTGIAVVKAFGMELAELNRFTRTSSNIRVASVRLARLEGFYHISVEMILVGSVVLVIWMAAPQVLAEQMTVGGLVAYLAYLARYQEPLKGLSKANFKIQKAMGAAQRIFEVLDTPVEDYSGPDTIILPRTEGRLRFDQVTFGYRPDEPVLRDFSLEIQPGEVVALVGPSGVGKSTLVNLLLRHYTPLAGTITVDGHPLETLNASSIRKQISLVPQEPFLFSTTVRENILYGRPEASDAEVEHAARAANIHDFIAALPQGYQTPVGQRGLALSGGQRQRIALARAFLRDAPVLVLDEATTSVDLEAEALIQEAVANLMGGRTTLIIAHRLSSLHHAQRIVILEEGRVSEQGSHQDLLAGNGLYRRLYDIQTLAQTT